MKYRIKKVGDIYYPQYKEFLFWRNFIKNLYACKIEFFSSFECAKEFIEKERRYIEEVNKYEQRETENKKNTKIYLVP